MISNSLREKYKKQGYAIYQYDESGLHSYPYDQPWISDKKFSVIYNKIKKNTLVDRVRCYSIYNLTNQFLSVKGDILEVGTWRGGTAGIFTTLASDRTVYLADTFTGVVKASKWEHYKDKAHDDKSKKLVTNFLDNDMKVANYQILQGIFPEETGKEIADEVFAIVYLDLDVYESTKDAFNYIWEKVSKNGIVIFDDYGMTSACVGISRFVDEIKSDDDKIFITNLNGQAYIIKK